MPGSAGGVVAVSRRPTRVTNAKRWFHSPNSGALARYGRVVPREHELYLSLYGRTASKLGWITLAWTLPWNHHHFLIKLTDGGLSQGMRVINTSFSRRMNAMRGRTGTGHLVKHGFYAGLLETESHLFATCRYIELNAVTARENETLEHWPWSGYRAAVGLEHPRPFHHISSLLELFGPTPNAARRAYRRFVEDGLDPQAPVLLPGDGDKPRA